MIFSCRMFLPSVGTMDGNIGSKMTSKQHEIHEYRLMFKESWVRVLRQAHFSPLIYFIGDKVKWFAWVSSTGSPNREW